MIGKAWIMWPSLYQGLGSGWLTFDFWYHFSLEGQSLVSKVEERCP